MTSWYQVTPHSLSFISTSESTKFPVPSARVQSAKCSVPFAKTKNKTKTKTKPSDSLTMLPAASQLTIRSAFETMLAWTGSKSSRPTPEDKTLQKTRDIFSIVVTPDRIPKFCIPSLEIDRFAVQLVQVEDSALQPHGSMASGEKILRPRPRRSKSELCVRKKGVYNQETWHRRETLCSADAAIFVSEQAGEHSDPLMRAALSLPHLSKITTPYGFLTLGESPNIRRKESLFFEYESTQLRMLSSSNEERTHLPRHLGCTLTVQDQPSKSSTQFSQYASWEKLCNQLPCTLHRPPSAERCTSKCEKKRFQLLMKKHLPSLKRINSQTEWSCTSLVAELQSKYWTGIPFLISNCHHVWFGEGPVSC